MKASPQTKWKGHWCLPLSGKPYGFAALTLLGLGIDTTRGSMPSAAPGCCGGGILWWPWPERIFPGPTPCVSHLLNAGVVVTYREWPVPGNRSTS